MESLLNDTAKCDEIPSSPIKKDEHEIKQMIDIASQLHKLMREDEEASSVESRTASTKQQSTSD